MVDNYVYCVRTLVGTLCALLPGIMKAHLIPFALVTALALGCSSSAEESDTDDTSTGAVSGTAKYAACKLKQPALGLNLSDYATGCRSSDYLCVWFRTVKSPEDGDVETTNGAGACQERTEIERRAAVIAANHLRPHGLRIKPQAVAVDYFASNDLKDERAFFDGSAFRFVFPDEAGSRFFVSVYLKPDLKLEKAFIATNPMQLNVSAEVQDNFSCLVSTWKCGLTAEQADKKCPRGAGAKALSCADALKR